MILFLALVIMLLVILLTISCVYLFKFSVTIMNVEEAVNTSLGMLETSYAAISKVLEVPVGSDDPFIRSVIAEIKRSQDAVLLVANRLTEGWQTKDNDE